MTEIMIGDIIKLKINAPGLSRFDLFEAFAEFEIVDIEKGNDDEYIISIRSFEPGIKRVQIGGKILKIKVISLLDEIDRNDLFEPDLSIKEPSSIYIYILGIILTLPLIVR